MNSSEDVAYLMGGPMRRWGGLLDWSMKGRRKPPAAHRRLAMSIACTGLRIEYQGWRAKMSAIMLITSLDTRFAGYTSARILKRLRRGKRP